MTELVLSLFPGVGLLDRAFSNAGFCVVQAQDKITGGDIRDFSGISGRFSGPDVRIEGYSVQRIPITDLECGGVQLRSRHIQFGSAVGHIIRPIRVNDCTRNRKKGRPAKAVTTKTERWKDYPDVCRRQGLDKPIELRGVYRSAKVEWVANGVPLRMGLAIAEAIKLRAPSMANDCQCGCGRSVSPRALTATASCRKRKQLSSNPGPWVDVDGYHE